MNLSGVYVNRLVKSRPRGNGDEPIGTVVPVTNEQQTPRERG